MDFLRGRAEEPLRAAAESAALAQNARVADSITEEKLPLSDNRWLLERWFDKVATPLYQAALPGMLQPIKQACGAHLRTLYTLAKPGGELPNLTSQLQWLLDHMEDLHLAVEKRVSEYVSQYGMGVLVQQVVGAGAPWGQPLAQAPASMLPGLNQQLSPYPVQQPAYMAPGPWLGLAPPQAPAAFAGPYQGQGGQGGQGGGQQQRQQRQRSAAGDAPDGHCREWWKKGQCQRHNCGFLHLPGLRGAGSVKRAPAEPLPDAPGAHRAFQGDQGSGAAAKGP
jgi:hypothetical protein